MPSETRARRLHYNGVLQEYSKTKLWDLAISLLQSLPSQKVRPDKASFNISIYACDEASCWPCALLLFDLLKSSYLLPSIVTYNSTIRAWARDSWRQALQFLQLVYHPDLVGCNTSLRAASWCQALNVLDEMQSAAMVPDIVSQNSVLYSLQKGAQWQTALTTLDTCHCSSLQTSSVTYGTLLKLCKDSWLLALHSLQRMGWVNLESNVVISGSMIASCETVSLWLRAMELLQYPSIIGCNSLIHSCGRSSRWVQAAHLFTALNTTGSRPSIQSTGAVTAALSQAALWQRATRFAPLQLVSSTSVISACENSGKWRHASAVLDAMRCASVTPNVITYSSAISALEKAGRWKKAMKMLRNMEQMKVIPNDVSYTGALGACEKATRHTRRMDMA